MFYKPDSLFANLKPNNLKKTQDQKNEGIHDRGSNI